MIHVFGTELYSSRDRSPETLVRETMRQMSAQGSPLPMHTGEHPPLLKRSDGSEDSQTSMVGTDPPTRTQPTTQPSQVHIYTLYTHVYLKDQALHEVHQSTNRLFVHLCRCSLLQV